MMKFSLYNTNPEFKLTHLRRQFFGIKALICRISIEKRVENFFYQFSVSHSLKSASKKFGYKSENFMTNFLQKMN